MTARHINHKIWRSTAYVTVTLMIVMVLAAGCDDVIRTGAQDIVIIKLNHDGSVAWTKTIDGGKHYTMYDLIQTSDGGYALGGLSSTPLCNPQCKGYTDQAPTIIRLSDTGDVISEFRFPFEMRDKEGHGYPIFRIVQTPDNGFYALSETGTILSISPIGIPRGSRFIDINNLNKNGINSFIRTSDGGSVVSGYTVSCEQNPQGVEICPVQSREFKAFVEKLDRNGNTTWTRFYVDKGFTRADQIIELNDYMGYASIMEYNSNISLVMLDRDGEIINSSAIDLDGFQYNLLPGTSGFSVIIQRNANNTYPIYFFDDTGAQTAIKMINFSNQPTAVIVPSDSGYLSVSYVKNYFTNISVRKMRSDGELVWDREIYSSDSIWDVIETSDAGYLVVLGVGKEGNSKY